VSETAQLLETSFSPQVT